MPILTDSPHCNTEPTLKNIDFFIQLDQAIDLSISKRSLII